MWKTNLRQFTKEDNYSLILFALYMMRKDPKYSTLSELIYLFDEDTLLRLCKYYGGLTITIPTLDDLENLIKALNLYDEIIIQGKDEEECFKQLSGIETVKRQIKDCYFTLKEVLSEYNFSGNGRKH